MLVNKTYEITSCDDIELGIKRTSKLEYRMSFDDEKFPKAIVFAIGGFGANANLKFLDFDREYLSKRLNVVVVNVFYHCFCHRRSDDERYSAIKRFEEEDVLLLKDLMNSFGIRSEGLSCENAPLFADFLMNHIRTLKEEGKLYEDYKAILTSSFIPLNDEYQNYGIMAAIDHINTLKDIFKKYPKFKTLPKIYGGGSYGGYLALLIAKIAPWYVDGVIDNSGGALPPFTYFLGREFDQCDCYYEYTDNIVKFFTKTLWTRKDPNSPYYFKDENYLIRALLNQTHLILQAQKNKDIIYISYHAKEDDMVSSEYKIQLIDILKKLGFEVD